MDKIYVGSGKEKKFSNGGSLISVTLNLDDLIREYNNHGFMTNKGNRAIKITVGTRREVGQYGDTHTVTLDTWHPDSFNTPQPIEVTQHQKAKPEISETDEILF